MKHKWQLNTSKTQILDEKGFSVASIHPYAVKTAEERDAVAALLVSAPALLEALEAIQQAFVDGEISFSKKRQSEDDPYHPANIKMCAALRAAKGGTP